MSLINNRYFKNELDDYKSGAVKIDEGVIKHQIQNIVEDILIQQPANYRNCRGGLYVGDAGIAYMLYYLIKSNLFPESNEKFYQQALQYIESSNTYLKKKHSEDDIGFLLGSTGVHAVTAAVYDLDIERKSLTKDYAKKFLQAAEFVKNTQWDEVLVGRAGYLSGALWINKVLSQPAISSNTLYSICDKMVQSGRQYAAQNSSPCPLMYSYHGSEYLGAAHGLSAILQMLLSAPGYLDKHPQAMKEVKESVDYMLSVQNSEGNFPCTLDEVGYKRPENKELVHWCHGGPGVVYLMAKAYLTYKDDKYLLSCLKTGDLVWNKGLLRKGPGICHGVAGSGYVFLLLYRLTGDQKHLHRANKMAEFMRSEHFRAKARTPDSPYSLYEGTAGTVCFLIDLIKKENASFPFLDVFSDSGSGNH
ncbi:lanC-like protein 3 homolog [Ctenocephalides felis]|uniref:lanC-like protein 3 homolog n=1 Tax=Ctenocephalides felis TaxID=7515 RepID=UPI000E6E2F88|nr:lanC-like protein 3 homolog [Ctenocephalides felis]XP_026477960.1 lanC-like protein 3 homolog [Ctenocephalides felis]